jgi:hypothetical protein
MSFYFQRTINTYAFGQVADFEGQQLIDQGQAVGAGGIDRIHLRQRVQRPPNPDPDHLVQKLHPLLLLIQLLHQQIKKKAMILMSKFWRMMMIPNQIHHKRELSGNEWRKS